MGGCTDRFCKNVDAKDLSISAASGRINLKNVEVKPSAFDDLRLPITVKSGTVRCLNRISVLQTRGAIRRSRCRTRMWAATCANIGVHGLPRAGGLNGWAL